MQKVLVNLSLPRKLTDRPDMTSAIYRCKKTQQEQNKSVFRNVYFVLEYLLWLHRPKEEEYLKIILGHFFYSPLKANIVIPCYIELSHQDQDGSYEGTTTYDYTEN